MLKPSFTAQFKRDYKLAIKRGRDSEKIKEVLALLCEEIELPEKCHDHGLTNSRNYKDVRECHIEPDFLLIYKPEKEELQIKFIRMGTHSDLF